jgi:hypothetical protein
VQGPDTRPEGNRALENFALHRAALMSLVVRFLLRQRHGI